MAAPIGQIRPQRVETLQVRRTPRVPLQAAVFLKGTDASGTEFIELTKTINISSIGACITSTHMLRHEQTVLITVPAPSQASSTLIPRETPPISAKVKWQESLGELRLFGVEFLRPLE